MSEPYQIVAWLFGAAIVLSDGACAPATSAVPPPATNQAPRSARHRIDNRGVKLACREMGSGVPIVVLSGGPQVCGGLYEKKLSPMAKEFRLLYWDYRGCGDSSPAESYSMAMDQADLTALVTQLKLERPVLFGHSYGGMLALRYALAYPKRLSALVLVNTTSDAGVFQRANERKKENLLQLGLLNEWRELGSLAAHGQASAEQERRYWEIEFHNHLVDKRWIPELLETFQVNFPGLRAMQEELLAFSVSSRLDQIEVPTLIISGRHDMISQDEPKRLHAGITGSTYIEYVHSGHVPFVEENKKFIGDVSRWIREQHIGDGSVVD